MCAHSANVAGDWAHFNESRYTVGVTPTVDYDNNYSRDPAGTWTYKANGAPVPGARDLLLMDRFAPTRTRRDEHGFALFDRPTALTDPDLSWIRDEVPRDTWQEGLSGKLGVPWPEWERRAHRVVGMQAPELHPQALLSTEHVASLAGLTAGSLMEYVRRGTVPAPTVRQGRSLLWSKPIVMAWLVGRKPKRDLKNPRHLVSIDRATGRTAVQVGKVDSSPWSLVVTVDTMQPLMVNLVDNPLLPGFVESPFRLEANADKTRLFAQNIDGSETEIPVSDVISDWQAQHGGPGPLPA